MPRIKWQKLSNIKIIGVGNAGMNCIGRLEHLDDKGIDRIAVGLTGKTMSRISAKRRIALNKEGEFISEENFTEEEARDLVEKKLGSIDEIARGADIVFIVGALGRHINGMSISQIGEKMRKRGILTFVIGTKPFFFEGKRVMETAERYIRSLPRSIDSLLVISNDALLKSGLAAKDAMSMSDQSLDSSIDALLNVIHRVGTINVDFNDFRSTIETAGRIYIGTAEGKRSELMKVLDHASKNDYYDIEFQNAGKLLYVITADSTFMVDELRMVGDFMSARSGPDVRTIFGIVIDPKYIDKIGITVLAGSFDGIETVPMSEMAERPREKRSDVAIFAPPELKNEVEEPDYNDQDNYDVPALFRRQRKEVIKNEDATDEGDDDLPKFLKKRLEN